MEDKRPDSYKVLAIRWRPQTFEDVVGQSHVTGTLVNAIRSGRVGHAYLFSGPRGVGKTTTARLLAKALNCPNAKDAVPCNECDVCREIKSGTSLDVIEIDGASNRGIDEIRNLRENVKYAPAGGKFKIYVVDEVHMLTDAAFNALLKTLEEPPPHVKFVLATTAPLKVPETILSRCQRFEFVRIPTKDVFATLKRISSADKFEVSDEVLMLLSRRANGSLRDAESMLDQLVSAGLASADEAQVARLMGLSGADTFFAIIDAVRAKNAGTALRVLGELFEKGANLDEFTDGLMGHLRNLLLLKINPELASLVDASSGHVKRYEDQAKQFAEADLLRLINIASRASLSVRRSILPRLHLEMAVVEMSYLDSTMELGELLERLERLESGLSGAPARLSSGPAEQGRRLTPPAQASVPQREKPPEPDAGRQAAAENAASGPPVPDLGQVRESWKEIRTRIESRKKGLGVWLNECSLHSVNGTKLVLVFPKEKDYALNFVDTKPNRKLIEEEILAVMKMRLGVSCVVSGAAPPEKSLENIIEYFNGEIVED